MTGRLCGLAVLLAAAVVVSAPGVAAQRRGGQPPTAASTARAAAPVDLTGTWVSVITEDWRWRMVMPPKGDYASVPITPAAKRVADAWDPAKDTAAGEQCRAYGAAGLMRLPTRLRISWLDDQTLRVESDAGTQTRLLRFGAPRAPQGPATWQGHSAAEWDVPARTLKVVTTQMRPGYIRKNGLPYSATAVLTEYWNLHAETTPWLVITSVINDPMYLAQPYITSPNFKKEPNDAKWEPTPCSATS